MFRQNKDVYAESQLPPAQSKADEIVNTHIPLGIDFGNCELYQQVYEGQSEWNREGDPEIMYALETGYISDMLRKSASEF